MGMLELILLVVIVLLVIGALPAWAMGPMSAPPPPATISDKPIGVRSDPISRTMLRAAALPENPRLAGSNTPESDSRANTWLVAWAA